MRRGSAGGAPAAGAAGAGGATAARVRGGRSGGLGDPTVQFHFRPEFQFLPSCWYGMGKNSRNNDDLSRNLAQAIRQSLFAGGWRGGGPAGGGQRRDAGSSNREMRPGDWTCASPKCRCHNFARRTSCFWCGNPQPSSARGGRGGGGNSSETSTTQGAKGGAAATTRAGSSVTASGGNLAGRSFSDVAAAARGSASTTSNARARANSAGPRQAQPQRVRQSWVDLADEDDDDDDRGLADGQGDKSGGGGGGGDGGDDAGGDDPKTIADIQTKINSNKAALRWFKSQGLGPGDQAVDGAQADLDKYTAQLEEMQPEAGRPSAAALRRARLNLERAVRARADLDTELQSLEERFLQDLEQHQQKVNRVEERLKHHKEKVAEVEAAIGGGRGVAPGTKSKLKRTAERLEGMAPRFSAMLEAMSDKPGVEDLRKEGAEIGNELGIIFTMLGEVAKAFQGKADAASDDDSDSDDESDEDDDEEGDEEDDEMHDGTHASDPELLEENGNGQHVPVQPEVGKTKTGGAADGKAADPPSVHAERADAAAAPATQPTAEASPTANGPPQPPPQSPSPPRVVHRKPTTKDETKSMAKLGKKAGATLARCTAALEKVKGKGKVPEAKPRGPHTVGGATAPTPEAMQDTSAAAQEQNPIVADEAEL